MTSESASELRLEIAMRAARLIAEDGLDYASAKKKAMRDIVGDVRLQSSPFMPDNAEVEEEVRAYQALFQADEQPLRLAQLRQWALDWMDRLAAFEPRITGAVWRGTAGAHSDIHLELFVDSAKEVEIFLINAGLEFDVLEAPNRLSRAAGRHVECITLLWRPRGQREPEGLHLTVYGKDDLRFASARDAREDRGDRDALLRKMDEGVQS